ncbi:MAG: NADH-quinone oxidoreductase subunit NuoG, partial [Anderseniella sp.]
MVFPIIINGIKLIVKKNTTILEACLKLNINIPRFCYHKNLEVAGNCRMCLVEVKNLPKPIASCAMPVSKDMEIFTNTPKIKKARESVLEFLLINHPLDCPICDQGGECDLQDQTLFFGSDRSRFFNLKRTVEDKNFGPFIKTIMTRCIHCTRCVRFANEVSNVNLGTIGRGNKTEISFYINKIFNSEFSGNIIDLCPVGALTSKPFSFKSRNWELKKTKAIDILDSTGLNIIINSFNNRIIRILPKNNWISNKTRFFFDSIEYQRIKSPLLKINKNEFKQISWKQAFFIINYNLKKNDSSKNTVLIGDLLDIQSLFKIKNIMNSLGINNINYLSNKYKKTLFNSDISNNLLNNNLFLDIQNSNLCFLINLNPQYDNAYLNLFLNNQVKRNNLKIFSIGQKLNLPYKTINLGLSENILLSIIEGRHKVCKQLIKAKNPIFICNEKTLSLINYKNFFKFNTINIKIFNFESGFLNFSEIFTMNKNKSIINSKLIFLFNIENIKKQLDSFIIYQGHHFTPAAQE